MKISQKTIDEIFQISKRDTSFTGLEGYNFDYFYSNELEETFGVNLQYDFKLTKYLAGKIKVGNKFRTKTRTYDKNHEYAPVAAAAGLAGPRDSLAKHFPQILENRGPDARRMSMWAFINNNYDYYYHYMPY